MDVEAVSTFCMKSANSGLICSAISYFGNGIVWWCYYKNTLCPHSIGNIFSNYIETNSIFFLRTITMNAKKNLLSFATYKNGVLNNHVPQHIL